MDFKEWLNRRDENLYGVYCGPGPKLNKPSCDSLADGGDLPTPIDDLDDACKDHDIEYCRAGADWRSAIPFSRLRTPKTREADIKLMTRASELAKNKDLPRGAKNFSRLLRQYFRLVQL